MKTLRLILSLLALPFCMASAHAQDMPVFAEPPRLATTPAELAATKASPDFETVRTRAVAAADAVLAKKLEVPRGYGGWVFYYACPTDGTTLQMISPTEHQCPRDKKIYSDENIVAAWRAFGHNNVNNAVQTLGWAYAYSGDARYAADAKRLLLQLARDYPGYPERQDRWGRTGLFAALGGRRYVQSLDEAVGIIALAKGYDLTRSDPLWTAEEKQLVERDLFGLTAETLQVFNQDINNHQTWYNAGLMACASVRGDADLVKKVLTMRGGYYDQLKRSIGADGLWYEGTIAYHGYALHALFEIIDIGRRLGLPLQNEPKVKAAIEGPLRVAYPNGQFPAINDSDRLTVDRFRGEFDWAYRVYGDKRFDVSKGSMPVATQSEALTDAGLAVLRQGEGANATCTFLDYGPHGGGHGHYDKLQILLYANGREWLLDPGRLDYSQPEYKTWVKETAAHNTVTLGGASQKPTTGKLLFMQPGKDFAACAAQSDGAYEGAVLTRRLLLTKNYLVDIFDVAAPAATQIDWFAHAVAARVEPVQPLQAIRNSAKPFELSKTNGYQHLLNPDGFGMIHGPSRWDFVADATPQSPRLRVWFADDFAETVVSATGIGYNMSEKLPLLIRRRTDTKTRFVTVYDLSGNGSYIHGVAAMKGGKPGVNLATAEGNFRIEFETAAATVKKVK